MENVCTEAGAKQMRMVLRGHQWKAIDANVLGASDEVIAAVLRCEVPDPVPPISGGTGS